MKAFEIRFENSTARVADGIPVGDPRGLGAAVYLGSPSSAPRGAEQAIILEGLVPSRMFVKLNSRPGVEPETFSDAEGLPRLASGWVYRTQSGHNLINKEMAGAESGPRCLLLIDSFDARPQGGASKLVVGRVSPLDANTLVAAEGMGFSRTPRASGWSQELLLVLKGEEEPVAVRTTNGDGFRVSCNAQGRPEITAMTSEEVIAVWGERKRPSHTNQRAAR